MVTPQVEGPPGTGTRLDDLFAAFATLRAIGRASSALHPSNRAIDQAVFCLLQLIVVALRKMGDMANCPTPVRSWANLKVGSADFSTLN
jgi:hypothetical protein